MWAPAPLSGRAGCGGAAAGARIWCEMARIAAFALALPSLRTRRAALKATPTVRRWTRPTPMVLSDEGVRAAMLARCREMKIEPPGRTPRGADPWTPAGPGSSGRFVSRRCRPEQYFVPTAQRSGSFPRTSIQSQATSTAGRPIHTVMSSQFMTDRSRHCRFRLRRRL